MKYSLMTALVIATTIGFSAQAQETYKKDCNLFGCVTLYSGGTGADDVERYVHQSSDLVKSILNSGTNISNIDYRPSTGDVVVVQSANQHVSMSAPRKIANMFKDKRLNVKRVVVFTSANQVRYVYEVRNGNTAGFSRFNALNRK